MKTAGVSFAICATLLVTSLTVAQKSEPGIGAENAAVRTRSPYAELASAPEKARARRNPLEADPQAPRAGRKLFARHCAECHGENAEGTGKAPTLRAPEIQNAEPGALYWVLTNGAVRRGMPVWSKLPEPQRWQLVSYLKSLNAHTRTTSTSSQMPGS